jgi:hypothetical protein
MLSNGSAKDDMGDKDATIRSARGAYASQTLPRPHIDRAVPRATVHSAGNDRVQSAASLTFGPTRILSRYSETADDDVDFDCLDVVSTPKNERARRVQDRLRKGLQPRRHIPTPSDLGRISAWQANPQDGREESFDDDFDLPPQLILGKQQLITNKALHRPAETEEWDEPVPNQKFQKGHPRSHHGRASTGSSSFSLSVTSTVESEDFTEGLELPNQNLDLRQRFRENTSRRAAGETLRGRSKSHSVNEGLLQGLVLEADTFVSVPEIKHANVKRGIASSPSAMLSTVRPTATFKGRPPIPSFGADEPRPYGSTRQGNTSANTSFRTGTARSQATSPAKDNASPSGTMRSNPGGSQRSKPAFLPGGAASSADRSYHVSAISTRQSRQDTEGSAQTSRGPLQSQRTTGTSPAKRRATASEALKSELSKRKPALTHVRSKTYGEGHELDGIEDLPVDEERGTVRHRDGRRRPSGPQATAASSRAKAAMLAEQRLQNFKEQRDRGPAQQGGGRRAGGPGTLPLRQSQLAHDDGYLRRGQSGTGLVKPGSSSSAPAASRPAVSAGSLYNREPHKAATMAGPRTSKKRKHGLPLLIANLNTIPQRQQLKNMRYNPTTFRWEGNEEEMERFDAVSRTPPRIALISNRVHTAMTGGAATTAVTGAGGKKLQVEGGMVFDPDQMCWLKVGALEDGASSSEEDPFDGIDDLVVEEIPTGNGTVTQKTAGMHFAGGTLHGSHASGSQQISEQHFMVGEEFDVGPGFIKRQRAYEETWRQTTTGWIVPRSKGGARIREERTTRLWELYHLVCD